MKQRTPGAVTPGVPAVPNETSFLFSAHNIAYVQYGVRYIRNPAFLYNFSDYSALSAAYTSTSFFR